MSLSKVKEYLKKYKMDNRIMEFDTSTKTVSEAAHNLNCDPERIAKTMSFDINDNYIVIVTSGDMKIDNAKYKKEFHTKAKMVKYELVESLIGHEPGGVCPFGLNENVLIYLDISLKKFNTVYPACGSSNSAIEVSISELEKIVPFVKWIDVCTKKTN